MCYSMLCKYQDRDGECTILHKLGTDEMPEDAACIENEEGEK